jgi:hypothetical protein
LYRSSPITALEAHSPVVIASGVAAVVGAPPNVLRAEDPTSIAAHGTGVDGDGERTNAKKGVDDPVLIHGTASIVRKGGGGG